MISHEFYIAANKPKKQSKKEENSKYSELQINKNQKKKIYGLQRTKKTLSISGTKQIKIKIRKANKQKPKKFYGMQKPKIF